MLYHFKLYKETKKLLFVSVDGKKAEIELHLVANMKLQIIISVKISPGDIFIQLFIIN